MKDKTKGIPISIFAAILSILNLLLYNIPFFAFVSEHAEFGTWGRIGLIAALVVIVLVVNYVVFYLLLQLLRYVGRVIISLLFLISGISTYFVFVYHNLMDEAMISNVFNTRASEVAGFIHPSLFIGAALLGLVPTLYVLLQKVRRQSWKLFGICTGSGLGLTLILVLINLNQVLWIGKYDTELGGLTMPWSWIVNTGLYVKHNKAKEVKERPLPPATISNENKEAFVLIIGESSRKANWQLYGYERPTNPRLSQREDLVVLNAEACATYTTAGVKSILEHKATSDLYEILPNYLFNAGVDVIWRTHNWGEPPVHINEYETMQDLGERYGVSTDYDETLFVGLRDRIEQSDKNKVLIILHTNTSHGPDYQRQYPPQYEYFKPVCSRVEDAQKEPKHLMNAYDNTIRYTDALIANLIDTLQTITDYDCSVLYVSDHGESLGEKGLFMHGVPLKVAPKEQYEIPMVLWTSTPRKVKDVGLVDQHYVFHTVLTSLSIDSEIYDEEYDLWLK